MRHPMPCSALGCGVLLLLSPQGVNHRARCHPASGPASGSPMTGMVSPKTDIVMAGKKRTVIPIRLRFFEFIPKALVSSFE